MFFSRTIKLFIIGILAFVFATVITAFAASNSVPDAKAGDGSGTISGYTVSNVVYNLNAGDPSQIDSVQFDLDDTASTVEITLVNGSSTFYSCTNTSGNTWLCTTAGATVSPADELRVVAAE